MKRIPVRPYNALLVRSFATLAAVLGAVALIVTIGQVRFFFASDTAVGTVTDFYTQNNVSPFGVGRGENTTRYYPIIRFADGDGRLVEFRAGVGGFNKLVEIGDAVAVRFHPDRPSRATIDSFLGVWVRPLVFGGLAVFFGLISLLMPFAFGAQPHSKTPDDEEVPTD